MNLKNILSVTLIFLCGALATAQTSKKALATRHKIHKEQLTNTKSRMDKSVITNMRKENNNRVSQVYTELRDYFYPMGRSSYILSPYSKNPNIVITYILSDSNILTKAVEWWDGYSIRKISEEAHKLNFDENRQAVVSTQQIREDILSGISQGTNKTIMFRLPKDNKNVTWTESGNGETRIYSAKFVYIAFTSGGKKLYRKAVKIEKIIPYKDSSSVKEWSYWVKGLSRLATYGSWRDPKKVHCIEISVEINIDDHITEITKAEFNSKK